MEEEKPIDLKLHQALNENLDLIKKLNELVGMVYWIKFFMVFLGLVVILILFKYFGFF